MSPLEKHVDDYLRLRRTLGYDLVETGRLLHRFAGELDAAGATHITTQVAVRWALAPKVSAPSSVPATRYRAVRGFARYMAGIDPATEIPPAGLVRRPRSRRPPFIYTDEELLALLAQARAAIPQPLRAATMRTLIGLLAASGLRVGEALRLDRGDIDWPQGVLHIRQSKFNKSRLVPLSPSVVEVMERYAHLRDRGETGRGWRELLRLAPWHARDPRMRVEDVPGAVRRCRSWREQQRAAHDPRPQAPLRCPRARRLVSARASTFSPVWPGSRPTSGIATRSRATGICPPRRSCSRMPPACSTTRGR